MIILLLLLRKIPLLRWWRGIRWLATWRWWIWILWCWHPLFRRKKKRNWIGKGKKVSCLSETSVSGQWNEVMPSRLQKWLKKVFFYRWIELLLLPGILYYPNVYFGPMKLGVLHGIRARIIFLFRNFAILFLLYKKIVGYILMEHNEVLFKLKTFSLPQSSLFFLFCKGLFWKEQQRDFCRCCFSFMKS